MNPMLEHLSGGGPGIMGMINMIRNANNPSVVMNQFVQSNPQMQQVINVINQNGGDARKAFYAMAQQKGIDPNSILSMLK